MTPSPSGEPSSTGPPDRQTLRLVESLLMDEPIVATTEFEPDSYEPRILHALCEESRYPATVETARLDIRWFASGDFSLHYVETIAAGQWECRWDRHPNPHNARLHFHRPPDGGEITDLTWPSLHPIDVLSTVIAAIEQRIEQHWSPEEF
jgi:hypothetical protein